MNGLVTEEILRDRGGMMGKVRVGEMIRGSWREKGEREGNKRKGREREKEREEGREKMSQIPMPFNREQNQTELIM